MKDIQYGSTQKTKIVDENGSTLVTTTNYRAGVGVVTQRMNLRERLPSRELDIDEIGSRLAELFQDPTKINPSIELESKSNGQQTNHYLVTSYTILDIE